MKEKMLSVIAGIKEKFHNILSDAKKKRVFITLTSVISALLILIIACGIYVGDYYRADLDAINSLETYSHQTYRLENNKKVTVYAPSDAKAGFIFYPGGKVEAKAYQPLLDRLAAEGILCVLIEMPFNLAVLDVNAAKGICDKFPEIENWYIGGHSLGGSMAASYLQNHKGEIDGLILLGSYSTADLSDSRVLSVYGSEDGIMNREKYDKYKSNLPADFSEKIIEGGNHAYFGMYGNQKGDGIAKISNIDQIQQTIDAITKFIFEEN